VRELDKEIDNIYEKFKSDFGGWPPEPKSFLVSQQYQEVFSDLIPVLRTRDPEAVANLMRSRGSHDEAAGRSFGPSTPVSKTMGSENHELLHQTKKYLWNTYISKFPNRGRDSEFLARVFRVFAEDIMDRERGIVPNNQTREEFNRRLIQRLDNSLSDFRPANR